MPIYLQTGSQTQSGVTGENGGSSAGKLKNAESSVQDLTNTGNIKGNQTFDKQVIARDAGPDELAKLVKEAGKKPGDTILATIAKELNLEITDKATAALTAEVFIAKAKAKEIDAG